MIALNLVLPDKQQGAEEKACIFALSSKLWNARDVELSLEERKLIQDKVAVACNPLVDGRVCEILDPKDS